MALLGEDCKPLSSRSLLHGVTSRWVRGDGGGSCHLRVPWELGKAELWGRFGDDVSQYGVTKGMVCVAGTKSFWGKNHLEWQIWRCWKKSYHPCLLFV